MDKKKIEELKKLSFENALQQLEGIVRQMENADMPLNEMMEAYETGQILAGICSVKLKSIEKKVEVLRKKATGEIAWEEFALDENQTRQNSAPQQAVQPQVQSQVPHPNINQAPTPVEPVPNNGGMFDLPF